MIFTQNKGWRTLIVSCYICNNHHHNKRLKRDCQRVALPVPLNRGGYGCCD
ncbi:hypothetical protein GZ634_003218 [Vibrio cholerae]|nr:hypothetical protein [Vibrio cholerae]